MFKNASFNLKNKFLNTFVLSQHVGKNLSLFNQSYSRNFAKKPKREDSKKENIFKNTRNDINKEEIQLNTKKASENKTRLEQKDSTVHCLVLHPIFHQDK